MTRQQLAAIAQAIEQTGEVLGWSERECAATFKVYIGLDAQTPDREVYRQLEESGIGFNTEAAIAAGGDDAGEPETIEAVQGGTFKVPDSPIPTENANLYAKSEPVRPEFQDMPPLYAGYAERRAREYEAQLERGRAATEALSALSPEEWRDYQEEGLMQDTMDRVESGL